MEAEHVLALTTAFGNSGRALALATCLGARQWADDRFENEFDGVPFVEQITLTEALTRLNELESSKKLNQEYCT